MPGASGAPPRVKLSRVRHILDVVHLVCIFARQASGLGIDHDGVESAGPDRRCAGWEDIVARVPQPVSNRRRDFVPQANLARAEIAVPIRFLSQTTY